MRDIVVKTAKAARLNLTEKEIEKFSEQLSDVIQAFKTIEKLDVKEEPSFQPMELRDVMRQDTEEQCLPQEEALANTKNKEKGFFKGPKVIDK